jgi:hypothetical protein
LSTERSGGRLQTIQYHSNTATTILKLAYGYDAKEEADPFIAAAEKAFEVNPQGVTVQLAEYYPICLFPRSGYPRRWLTCSAVRRVPVWMAPFKRQSIALGRVMARLGELPHDWVKERLVKTLIVNLVKY